MKIQLSSITHLNNAGYFYVSYNSLPQDRKDSVDRYHNLSDKFRCITAGELLLDAFLDSHPTLSSEDMGISMPGAHGKPYLKAYPDWKYNISHSGDYAAIAYDDRPLHNKKTDNSSQSHNDNDTDTDIDIDIGIDIQNFREISTGVAKRIITESEYSFLPASIDSRECQKLLNAVWTIKESYIKYIGTGLSFDMRNVQIANFSELADYIKSGSPNSKHLPLSLSLKLFLECKEDCYPDAFCRFFPLFDNYSLSVCSSLDNIPEEIIY